MSGASSRARPPGPVHAPPHGRARANGKRHAATSARQEEAEPRLEVRAEWRQVPCSQIELEQAARDVVQTLLAERQRRLDAPKLLGTRATDRGKTVQSPEALSYVLGEEQIVGLESTDPTGRTLTLRLSGGGTLDVKTRARDGARAKVGDMSDLPKPRRRPAKVKVRPGNRRAKPRLDPALGLEEILGEVSWQPASAGAYVAVVERDPEGSAVGCGRLSGEDRNETMVTQVEGLIDLEQRTPELTYRYLILAVDMSGKRLVRADPLIPPAPGTAERDDMVILDQFIQQGWVEHIAFWSVDRIARKVLPAHVLYDRWEQNDLGLWLVVNGGQIDYQDDDLLLGVLTMTSSNERKNIVRRTRGGLMRKGPLAGRGHLNTCPTFFRRDEFGNVEEDPAIWKYLLRICELADQGLGSTPSVGASTREISARLAEEGFEMDHDRIRVLLDNLLPYVTGEWTVKVSGIEIPQTPIQLKNPVPSDRAQRIRDWLELRKGGSENTQLGEYVFNYVETVHKQCEGEKGGVQNREIRIRGYNLLHIKRPTRMLRHKPVVPGCCKGQGRGKAGAWTWPADELERAAFLKVREIASHPEVLRQLTLATRHVVSDTSARLTTEERLELEQQLEVLIRDREAAADVWVEKGSGEGTPDFDDFKLVMGGYNRRITALQRRLENDAALAAAEQNESESEGRQDKRLKDFLEIMTVERPRDPRMMALRARLFSLIVSKVIIDDDGRGPITLILESNLVPPDSPAELANPLYAAGDFLDRYRREKEGRTNPEDRVLHHAEAVKTDFESSHHKSVFTLLPELKNLPTGVALRRMRRNQLDFSNWHIRGPVKPEGVVAWRASISITSEETLAGASLSEPELVLLRACRPKTIFSTSQILNSTDASGLNRQRRNFGLIYLERRGWLERIVVDGVSIWTVVEDYAHFFAKPEGAATAELVRADEPRKRGGRPLSAAAIPKTERSRARHAARQKRAHAAALEHSLSVAEALALTGLTCSDLLAGVRATELIVCVFPHGEVRFPRWQWDEEGRVRPEIAAIIATAAEHELWPYTLHRLLTRSRGRGYKAPLANLLTEEQGHGLSPSENALQVILEAIVYAAGLASSAPQRRKRRTPDSF